jgi:serine/threonine protein kinase
MPLPDLTNLAANMAWKHSRNLDETFHLVDSSVSVVSNFEFAWDELQIGRLLGKGSFSAVHELVVRSRPHDRDQIYAVKFLLSSTTKQAGNVSKAAADLAIECKLLTYLQHENIIQLHGVYYKNDQMHLVLDRLYVTLEERIRQWGVAEEKLPRPMLMIMPRAKRQRISETQQLRLLERIHRVALPIAKTLEYLHSQNIIFRDVKPRNIGFDVHGTVKLFDFGLARDVKLFTLKGKAGSPLYMAPEVALSQEYGLSADAYSFTVCLWELCTLKTPFEHVKLADHERLVCKGNLRPRVDYKCGSVRLRELLSNGWAQSPDSRPTFSTIVTTLDVESMKTTECTYKKMDSKPLSLARRVRAAY